MNETQRAVEAVWRMEAPKLVAGLARLLRDITLAEDLAQEALIAALRHWPESGLPRNPGAWLMATAKRRALDYFRHNKMAARNLGALAFEMEQEAEAARPDPDQALDDDIGDDRLGLIFVSCHPVLSADARVALTLRLLGGLSTEEIAHAFLVPVPTLAQRLVRAKRAIAEAQVPFEVPLGQDRAQRLGSVLEVLYLIFNEGYSASAGAHWTRPALLDEALRLGRILARLMPAEPEVHGLVALMEIQASRIGARTDEAGNPILLLEQDRSRWDQLLIRRGLAALERTEALGGGAGFYALQAAIAACHARARKPGQTDWAAIALLYDQLMDRFPSPVVALNRVVAISFEFGPDQALQAIEPLLSAPELRSYHLLPSLHGDLLFRLGRLGEARLAFERAAALTGNQREQALLLSRAAQCG